MRIGILTGGGDVPGLNPCIKAVVYSALDKGINVTGIRRGWGGLVYLNASDPLSCEQWTVNLTKNLVRTVDRTGGTFLHTSRVNPGRVRKTDIPEFLLDAQHAAAGDEEKFDFTPHVMKNIQALGIDALVTIGGDDTQSYALRLHREGFPVVAIPKTMDNDIFGTDYCIGFSTAITRSVDFINNLRTVAGSHERIAVVELFGRNSGETSLIAGYLASADRTIISEVPFHSERLAELLVEDKRKNPSHYAIVTISEGAQIVGAQIMESGEEDAYGHRKLGGIGSMTEQAIRNLTGQHTIYQQVAYLMRSGEPDALDRMVAFSYGNLAMELVNRREFGKLVALREGKYTYVSIETMTKGLKRVDVDELYDIEQYRPRIAQMLGKPMFLY